MCRPPGYTTVFTIQPASFSPFPLGFLPALLNICLPLSSFLFRPMPSRLSHVQLCATPRTVSRQALLSMGFSRQEYWSGLPCSPPGDLPDPGIEPMSPNVSCIGRQVLYHYHQRGSPFILEYIHYP